MLPTPSFPTIHLKRAILAFLLKATVTDILVQLKSNQDLDPCFETQIMALRLKFQPMMPKSKSGPNFQPNHKALNLKSPP